MRFLITVILLLVAAEAVDTIYFDGSYRDAALQQAQYQGQQLRSRIDSFVYQNVAP